jgi:hypothetical protein
VDVRQAGSFVALLKHFDRGREVLSLVIMACGDFSVSLAAAAEPQQDLTSGHCLSVACRRKGGMELGSVCLLKRKKGSLV